MESLFQLSQLLVSRVNLETKRYLLEQIDWSQRLIGIKGMRGVGKTTLILQHVKQTHKPNEYLYATLDHIYFTGHNLWDTATTFYNQGGKFLYLDEVHKYPNWSQEIKNIYDAFPDLHIVFTASSALEISKGQHDLSRRAIVYHLHGLSYREYLNFEKKLSLPRISLEDILQNNYSSDFFEGLKPLQYFKSYLKQGYYPFYKEGLNFYSYKINEVINQVIEVDLTQIENLDSKAIIQLKKLLFIISHSAPFKPNVSKIAAQLNLSRNTLLHYLHYLDKAFLTTNFWKDNKGVSLLQKPEKIYLQNPNLMYALDPNNTDIGNVRESFVSSQLKVSHELEYNSTADFLLNRKYTLEIGGKSKTSKQIKGVKDAYLVKDDIEVGFANVIPLWLLAFLY